MAIITKERLKDIQNYLGDQFKDHDFKFDQTANLTDQIKQTYLGLRYAVAQVNKLNISTDWEHDESARKAVIDNVHINVFNDSKTVALAKAGMELHGIMTDFPDEGYGQKMIDYVNNFAGAYSVDNSFGIYANQRTLLTMFMNIPCTLAPNGNKYVQQAQRSINYQVIGIENNKGLGKYEPLYPNDGLYHDTVQSKRVYKALIEILQNSLDLPVTGVYDEQTRSKSNQLNWDVVDKLTALALSLEGYWIGDINNVTYEDEANFTGIIQFGRVHNIDNQDDFYRKVFEYLPISYKGGNTAEGREAREKMHNASCMAGMAFANAFLGVCHSMAHKLGAFHHLPHGIANALLISLVVEFNSNDCPPKMGTFSQYEYPHTKERYAECARFCGFGGKNDDESVKNLIEKIEELKASVGVRKSIKEYGVDESYFLETLDEMVEQAFDDQCTGANPRYPLMSEIKELYLRAYYGK